MFIGELIFETTLLESDIQQVLDNLKKLDYIIKETDDWNAYEIYKNGEEEKVPVGGHCHVRT